MEALDGKFKPIDQERAALFGGNIFFDSNNPLQEAQYQELRDRLTNPQEEDPNKIVVAADATITKDNRDAVMVNVLGNIANRLGAQLPEDDVTPSGIATEIAYALADNSEKRAILFIDGMDTWDKGLQNLLVGMLATIEHYEGKLTIYTHGDVKKIKEVSDTDFHGGTRLEEKFYYS